MTMMFKTYIFAAFLLFSAGLHGQAPGAETRTIEQYLKLAEERIRDGRPRDASNYFNLAAEKAWDAKDYRKAVEYYKRSIEQNEIVSNWSGIAGIHTNLGLLYFDLGEYESSYQFLRKSYVYRKEHNERFSVVNGLINISVTLNRMERYDESIKALEEGASVAFETNDLEQLRTCYGSLSETHTLAGNTKKAAEYFDMYKAVHDAISGESERRHRTELSEATMRAQLAEMERELAESRRRYADYELAEKSRALAGLDSANRTLLESKSRSELYIKILEDKEKIAELEKREVEDRLIIEQVRTRSLIMVALTAIAVIFIVLYFLWQKKNDNMKLTQQRDQIDEQRTEIMDSIRYAQRIQFAMMPDLKAREEILSDHFIFFLPRDIVSGDYYWATRRGNQTIVVAADCTGHGVPGAFLSILGISLLNEIVLMQGIETASEILDELRSRIKSNMSKTEEQRDGMDISLCIIDYDSMELQFAGAYNPLYVVRQGQLAEYKGDIMPVGLQIFREYEKNFSNNVIPLQQSDMLYIFSDGYFDQFGGVKNTKFRSKQFKQLLTNVSSLPTRQQWEILLDTFMEWKGEENQIDDILVIGMRVGNQ